MQIEDAAKLKSTAERQGKDLEVLPDARLFYIDKVLETVYLAPLVAAEAVPFSCYSWSPSYLSP